MDKIVLLSIILISNGLCSQITIHQDSRIDKMLTQKQIKQTNGYRVKICFDANKSAVDIIRNRFIGTYPKIDTYMMFEAPYFSLKVGDFRSLIEAEKFAEKIQGEYSINIVIKENINLPRID